MTIKLLTFKKDLLLVKQATLLDNNREKTNNQKIYVYQSLTESYCGLVKSETFYLQFTQNGAKEKKIWEHDSSATIFRLANFTNYSPNELHIIPHTILMPLSFNKLDPIISMIFLIPLGTYNMNLEYLRFFDFCGCSFAAKFNEWFLCVKVLTCFIITVLYILLGSIIKREIFFDVFRR